MKEILKRCRLNEEEMRKFNQLTRDMDHKEDHKRAYRTMMNKTRRELLKFIGETTKTNEQIKTKFEDQQDQINYHLSMLEQLFYVMNTESGWKATPRGIGFLHNAVLED